MIIANEAELLEKLEAVGAVELEDRVNLTCCLVRHSKIQTASWGYYYCARCGDQMGDSLGGTYDGSDLVIVGHDCPTCRENYENMDWRDKIFVDDPFQPRKDN